MSASALSDARLSTLFPSISAETIRELEGRGLLHISERQWRLGDDNNGSTRKLGVRKWKRGDNSGEAWHKLIGLDEVVQNDRRHVILVIEGSKDALAAAELARRCGILAEVGIVCALGSGYRPIPNELEKLRGRFLILIGDRDTAGIETTQIVSHAFDCAGIDYRIWDWSIWQGKCKDLFELLESGQLSGLRTRDVFSSFFPSQSSSLHVFKSSRPEAAHAGISVEERLGIVTPHVMTESKTGNAKSFQLARAIKNRKLDAPDIEAIARLWFTKSRPFLPPDADENEFVQKFFDKLQRVRFTDAGLKAAFERARTAKPPFIAARDGDVQVAQLAALCRELQREAGRRPFICPVSVVMQFLSLRWRSQAGWLLQVLEEEKVIECVERGEQNKPGKKGKPTLWRYNMPL
jgi:hypothetical protein